MEFYSYLRNDLKHKKCAKIAITQVDQIMSSFSSLLLKIKKFTTRFIFIVKQEKQTKERKRFHSVLQLFSCQKTK